MSCVIEFQNLETWHFGLEKQLDYFGVWQIKFMIIVYSYEFFKKTVEISITPKEGTVFTTEGFTFSKVSTIRTVTHF